MSGLDIEFKEIELTHANLTEAGKPVNVKARVGAIGGHHYSEKAACTYLYTIAGVFPVLETSEQITDLINLVTKGE